MRMTGLELELIKLEDCPRCHFEPIKRYVPVPVPMVLRCPECNGQHVDTPNVAQGWTNPPHRTHLCNFCGHLWRPFEYHTEGVA